MGSSEGDLSAFAALPRDRHFSQEAARGPAAGAALRLFSAETRPAVLQRLYESAARPALDARQLQQLDRMRRDGLTTSNLFLCRPYSKPERERGRARGQHRGQHRQETMDIETMRPAALQELRRWTSTEALGDVTVHPDCTVRITSDMTATASSALEEVDGEETGEETTSASASQVDHQLPTTEEQLKAIAARFPPEVVKVDVTGRSFTRLSQHRRSLIYPGPGAEAGEEVRPVRRPRPRRQRSRRRNTIAGTDQKEIAEALGADAAAGAGGTLATVDDIVLSSSSALLNASHPKGAKEASSHSDLKKWAFNSLKRWGRSRLRAMSGAGAGAVAAAGATMVSGELHAADPVDDINVYETVTVRRRGAGLGAGAGALGQRRLRAALGDEPPHSSSGNWSASSESGRASVNSDSSHHPKSSTCSSVLPHRRRFINHSTSSSVTSEGTLTPEDMAAAPFLDDGETSSVYSCDTEGYYTSFHMDSGLKTLKEEEVGTGLSLPATPMHSTSALSNCSSGRGSASLAQLTAESEYELFGKGSTSTTASSAGTVCTTLLVDNSRGDNSHGSDRSLSKGPAVPERKSSLNVPCSSQECPPCSTVVALIHNTSQGHSPRSLSGDSPDSGHNTSSSPAHSVSGPRDMETDALISPIPSIGSEMEFSECSDFEGTDRIERIRVKTTINTSRIPSMCAITPPQSDDETSVRQFSTSNGDNSSKPNSHVRPAAPLPQNCRNDNHSYNENHRNQMTDTNANKHIVDDNCNARPTTPVTSTSVTSIIHVDQRSGYATVETLDNIPKENNYNQKLRPPSPSGGTVTINSRIEEEESTSQPLYQLPLIKDALMPFSNMLSKFKKSPNTKLPKNSGTTARQLKCDGQDPVLDKNDNNDESGEYVTITDMRNNNKPSPLIPPLRSEVSEPAREPAASKTWENQEYISLNEIPAPNSTDHPASSVLSGSSAESSLERKKRQGARVTLDSEGKVVYSSDSLRRRKGAHTTFAPGQYVKDTSVSPSPSPVAIHRMPKSIIRPVQSQASGLPHGLTIKTSSNSASKPMVTETTRIGEGMSRPSALQTKLNKSVGKENVVEPNRASILQTSDPSSQRNNKVIIRAGLVSPTKDLSTCSVRSMSPRNITPTRGAYVHVQPDNRPGIKTNPMFLQTDFDGPDDAVNQPQESKQPPLSIEGKEAVCTNKKVLTISGEIGDALKNQKVKRSASYRMANFSPLISVCDVDIDKDQGDGDLDLGVADLGEAGAGSKHSSSPNASNNSAENVLNVLNPNMIGRRFYGAQVMVSPNILLSLSPNRVTKPPDSQKAKVLSVADCSSHFQKRVTPVNTQQQGENLYTVISSNQPLYQNLKLSREEPVTAYQVYEPRYAASPLPASPNRFTASEVYKAGRTIEAPLHSSTPTKPDSRNASPLINNTFSPIERHVSYERNEGMKASPIASGGRFWEKEEKKPCLVLSPKSTMTAEELYAKIHKSKKQMNIKYEPEKAVSPFPTLERQSPVGSDRSISPAGGASDPRLAARSRHSWSPNSSKYVDIASSYDPRSNTPSPNLRVPKDHGLTQVTSTYDFKRLLLQHGAGSGKSKISAVERLKQAKQAATNVIASSAPKFRFGSLGTKPVSNNPPLPSAPTKVISSKPSHLKGGPKSSLRFAAHRNDVRATPIIEDQHGEEHATEVLQIQQLSASPMAGRTFHRLRVQNSVQCPPVSQPTPLCSLYSEPEEPVNSQTELSKLESNQYSNGERETQSHHSPPVLSQPLHNNQYPKQLRFDVRQEPTTLEQPDYRKLRNESPTALETAL
ncbi:Nance-Horan syndrome protein [Frankliniella fusca]|uniref:Nance-Horan syndrome protein n=1 Tax=Frankliniella fusca TaxID=407009 RepID=A0AAE1LCF0_9NEOP|nr:Nance-Horan syndrome protein [Frankliniella fusca]